MLRLNTKLLQSIHKVHHRENLVTISSLKINVRSIDAKLPDIVEDNGLKYANALCFVKSG